MTTSFSERLLSWFDDSGRHDLPWQHNQTPYRVWLSEIMLQQTQVATVIDYYLRFTERFSSIKDLAHAELDEVLSLWTGLGYYARARNLHKTAQIVVAEHDGVMPASVDELVKLPGIGRSTAGAICALAYHKKTPILDGNVKRVLTRYAAIEGWPGKKSVENQLWSLAEDFLHESRVADYIQAQMDLGATVCTRRQPKCVQCPLNQDCLAYKQQETERYPTAKSKKALPQKQLYWLIVTDPNTSKVMLEKRHEHGIWGGLWSFPEYADKVELDHACRHYRQSLDATVRLSTISHVFSHFKLDIHPYLLQDINNAQSVRDNPRLGWYNVSSALRLGIPMPVKTLLTLLE